MVCSTEEKNLSISTKSGSNTINVNGVDNCNIGQHVTIIPDHLKDIINIPAKNLRGIVTAAGNNNFSFTAPGSVNISELVNLNGHVENMECSTKKGNISISTTAGENKVSINGINDCETGQYIKINSLHVNNVGGIKSSDLKGIIVSNNTNSCVFVTETPATSTTSSTFNNVEMDVLKTSPSVYTNQDSEVHLGHCNYIPPKPKLVNGR